MFIKAFNQSRIFNFRGNRNLFKGILGLSTVGTAFWAFNIQWSPSIIRLDASNNGIEGITVDKNVDPLPLNLRLSTDYQILGHGTRAVTFLKFKVYALGIYIANEDLSKIPTVLDSKFLSSAFIDTDTSKSHQENVLGALHDQEKSKILISNLLDSNIRLAARITPVRNTDFNHLRDGLIKSIIASGAKDEGLQEGLQELREAFTQRGSVPKNHLLILERLDDGKLHLFYENTVKGKREQLGTVSNPLISKLLFLQYLSGGLSPETKESCTQRISELV